MLLCLDNFFCPTGLLLGCFGGTFDCLFVCCLFLSCSSFKEKKRDWVGWIRRYGEYKKKWGRGIMLRIYCLFSLFFNEKEKLQSGVFVTMLQADFDSGCCLLVFNHTIVTVALRLVFSSHSSEPQTL